MPPEHIFCGNGAADVIFRLVRAKRPRTAMVTAPTFAEYEQALRESDCKVESVQLDALSLIHIYLYFAGAPVLAQRFVRAARKFKTEGSEKA